MKKSLIVTLALVFVLGIAGTAFAAANPFSDVPAKHWAYDAISQLAKAGIVEGYGDGTFKGDKTMTRYEMAIVAAKAMAKADKADAAQKAMIDKLSVEFATELNNLGVRVAKLEANQPNLKLTGTVDIRYTSQDYNNRVVASASQGQYRLRMDGVAKVDDKTTLGLRLTNNVVVAGTTHKYISSTFTTFGNGQAGDGSNNANALTLDRLFLARTIGSVKTTVGLQGVKLGSTNMLIDSGAYSFAGLKFEGKSGVVGLATQWGRLEKVGSDNKIDVASIEANAVNGKLAYGAGYATLKDGWNTTAHPEVYLAKYTYLNAKYTFASKFSLAAEYAKNNLSTATEGKTAYVAIATYGAQALAKAKDQNLVLTYFSNGKNGITRYSNFGDFVPTGTEAIIGKKSTALSAQYNYTFSPTFVGYVQYVKTTDSDNDNGSANDKGFKFIRVGVTAKF